MGVVVGWILVGTAADAVTETVTMSRQALTTVGESTRLVDGVFDDVADSIRDVQITLSDTSLTLTRASVITRNLGEVVTDEIPAAVDAVRESLPGLVETARVIDTTMRGLSFFGVAYDPDHPLHESIEVIDQRLERIPTLLRTQQDTLESVAADLGTFGSSTIEISDDLASIRSRLAEAAVVLDSYGSIVVESSDLLDSLQSRVESGAWLARLVLVLGGFGVALTQTMPIVIGLAVLRSQSSPA